MITNELEFPFDGESIIKRKRKLKKELLEHVTGNPKRIAILGGSTTNLVKDTLELFLLNLGIPVEFYESEYNRFYEDVMFDNPELMEFNPDIIYIHTTFRNLKNLPVVSDTKEIVNQKIEKEYGYFESLWEKAKKTYDCTIIQNNFEFPYVRNLGSIDGTDYRGYTAYVMAMNAKLAEYASGHAGFYINDIQYQSSCYGLNQWADPFYWQLYKYAIAVPAIPYMTHELASLIGTLYGKTKKVACLDLDNTLWGGVIGDDGVDYIEIGQETALAETYSEFQEYLKALKERGILLTINSKNEEEVALQGLGRPDSLLKEEDFSAKRINWNPKSENLQEIAAELNLLPESFVFIDDNPAEREIVRQQVDGCAVPELTSAEYYAYILDRNGYFDISSLSIDDMKRAEMYQANASRLQLEKSFADYGEYLDSLEMQAEIQAFQPCYLSRIAQLTNKSNQFNLTTKRCTETEIQMMAESTDYVTLYGKLEDKFGDNGVVSVVIGQKKDATLDLELWLMSCRVLKRDMEYAMLDGLVDRARNDGIGTLIGHYYPTAKNKMVSSFYDTMGFELISEDSGGNKTYQMNVKGYQKKNKHIHVK